MTGNAYEETDVVDIVDAAGAWMGRMPKAWIGTALLPEGAKQGKKPGAPASS